MMVQQWQTKAECPQGMAGQRRRNCQPRRAFSIAATSIFPISIIASKARSSKPASICVDVP
jgi:hypothetical protein